MSDSTADLTDWCQRGDHTRCDGNLHAGTGWHWWCICACHPEPDGTRSVEAKQVWVKARALFDEEKP